MPQDSTDAGAAITGGHTALGIELGSTRIKAVLIGPNSAALAVGTHDWENQFLDGVWTSISTRCLRRWSCGRAAARPGSCLQGR